MSKDRSPEMFYKIFSGNTEYFVKHTPPFAVDDDGKMKAQKVEYAKAGETYIPLTREQYDAHLNGEYGVSVAPLLNTGGKKNVCFYSVIDIDYYKDANGKKVSFTWLVQRLYTFGLKFSAFKSKSGGLHIYFFYRDAEDGKEAIATMQRVIDLFGLSFLYCDSNGNSKVEIFPASPILKPGVKGKCLFLPYFNVANSSAQYMMTGDTKLGLNEAMKTTDTMFTSLDELNRTLDALPYGDAPYCIQMLLLTGILGENSHRNDFLYTVALYLKIKFHEDFFEELKKANECCKVPLDEAEIANVYDSSLIGDAQIFGRCKKEPCVSYCNRKLCKLREIGVGKDKQNVVSNIEFGKIVRMLSEEPYYLWEARLSGTETYKQVRIDGEADLLNQKVIQKACIRYLNQTPITLKQLVWEHKLNEYLSTLEEVEVSSETDTSETSKLRDCFNRFLSNKSMRSNLPFMIMMGNVYYRDGVYYFMNYGLFKYLDTETITLGRVNLREKLIEYGCEEGELRYMRDGVERCMKCWVRKEDTALSLMNTGYTEVFDGSLELAVTKDSEEVPDKEESDADDTLF